MAIDRPGGDRPAPKGSKHRGERRAAAILFREEWRAAAGENSCRRPLRAGDRARSATLGQISPAKDATGRLNPDRRAKRSHRLRHPPPPTTHTAPRQDRPHLALRRAWSLKGQEGCPAPASRAWSRPQPPKTAKRLAVTTAGPRLLHGCCSAEACNRGDASGKRSCSLSPGTIAGSRSQHAMSSSRSEN